MMNIFFIALGGALGAVCRYGLNALITQKAITSFPVGILSVNILGSLMIGIFFALFTHLWDGTHSVKAFLIIGFLGSFTTFSAFSLDAVELLQQGSYGMASAYIFGTTFLAISATFAGLVITNNILS